MKESLFKRLSRRVFGSQKRAYSQGAVVDRLSLDWRLSSSSPNQETRADIRELRRRARALHRDDPYVNGAVREFAQNIIGEDGLVLHPKNTASNGENAEKANAALKAAWLDWSHPQNASTDGQQSFVELTRQIAESYVVDGEVFIRQHSAFPNLYGFALELIDPDLLDEQMNREPNEAGNAIVMGVEIDKWHRPLYYHFWTRHPAESGQRDRVAVPASEIIHLYKRKRIGQTRGLTHLAPIIFRLKMLGAYEDSEVTAARISSSKMGFMKTQAETADAFEAPQPNERIVLDVSPGSIEQLPPGMEFQPWDPQHPTTAFKDFVTAVLRSIAVGLGLSYTSLTGDLTAVNYSSIRAGLLAERDMYRVLQKYFAEHLHRLVFKSWLEMAVLSPIVQLPSRVAERWTDVEFRGRGWKWVDPYSEMKASEMAVALGLTSRQKICAESGIDFEEILKDLKREQELAEKYGVSIEGMNGKTQPVPNGSDTTETGQPDGSQTGKDNGGAEESSGRLELLAEIRNELRSHEQKALPPSVNIAPAEVRVDVAPTPVNLTVKLPEQIKSLGEREILHIEDPSTGKHLGYRIVNTRTVLHEPPIEEDTASTQTSEKVFDAKNSEKVA